MINPNMGDIRERAPVHLSSEDIAAGFDHLPKGDVDDAGDVPF